MSVHQDGPQNHDFESRSRPNADSGSPSSKENLAASYKFDYDPASRTLRCRLKGRVTNQGLEEWYRVVSKYVARINPQAGIVDLGGVTSFEVSNQMVHNLAALPPAFPEVDRLRVIVAHPGHIFGLARMFQILGERTRPMLQVVHTMEEAFVVLGVKECSFQSVEIE